MIVTGTWEDESTKEITRYTDLSTSDSTVATIDAKGVVSAHKVGPFTITTSIDGSFSNTFSANAVVNVTSISIEYLTDTLIKGSTTQLLVKDQDGTDVTNFASYVSGDEDIFKVSNTGLVTSVGIGETDITISLGSISDFVTFKSPSAISVCGGSVDDTSLLTPDGTCLKIISTTAGLFASNPTMSVFNAISYTDYNHISDASHGFSQRLAPSGVAMPVLSQPQGVAWCNELNLQYFNSKTNWSSPTEIQAAAFYNEKGTAQNIYTTYNYPWVQNGFVGGTPAYGTYILGETSEAFDMSAGRMKGYDSSGIMAPPDDRRNMIGQLCISAP